MVEAFVHYPRGGVSVVLTADQQLHLDRDFLTAGQDAAISRAPKAPFLIATAGRCWVMNPTGAAVTVYVDGAGRRFPVSERCGLPLDDGTVSIHVWDARFEVHATVNDSRAWPAPRGVPGTATQPGPVADDTVLALFRKKLRHKVILAAYLRAYFQPGIEAPAPLGRDATNRCMGLKSYTALESALDETCVAIWGDVRHRDELPGYLVRHRLLLAHDQGLVPHKECSHRGG